MSSAHGVAQGASPPCRGRRSRPQQFAARHAAHLARSANYTVVPSFGKLVALIRPSWKLASPSPVTRLERHTARVVPEEFNQVTLAPAETENPAGIWTTPEPLLDCQCQVVYAAPHISDPACDPHAPPCREGDHQRFRAGSSRAETSGATDEGTKSRRPFLSTISRWTSG